MPDLITANEYVQRFGYVETGDLLTKQEVINNPSDDSKAAYIAVMETDGKLNADVVEAIELYIDEAESLVKVHISGAYAYPPVNVEPILKDITKHIARYFFYDNFDRSTIPDNITANYEKYLNILEKIKSGDIALSMTANSDTTILYAI